MEDKKKREKYGSVRMEGRWNGKGEIKKGESISAVNNRSIEANKEIELKHGEVNRIMIKCIELS